MGKIDDNPWSPSGSVGVTRGSPVRSKAIQPCLQLPCEGTSYPWDPIFSVNSPKGKPPEKPEELANYGCSSKLCTFSDSHDQTNHRSCVFLSREKRRKAHGKKNAEEVHPSGVSQG